MWNLRRKEREPLSSYGEENDFFHVFADVIETDWRTERRRPKKGICYKSKFSEISRAYRTTLPGVAV